MNAELLTLTLAWALVGVFVPALLHKVREWPRFKASAAAYQLLPDGLVTPFGLLLIVAESAVVVSLTVGIWFGYTAFGFAAAAILFVIYFVAILVNLLRGRHFIDCGCGDDPTAIGFGVILRNAVLIAMATFGYINAQAVLDVGILVAGLSLAFALLSWCLYVGAEQLMANITMHRRLWLGETS